MTNSTPDTGVSVDIQTGVSVDIQTSVSVDIQTGVFLTITATGWSAGFCYLSADMENSACCIPLITEEGHLHLKTSLHFNEGGECGLVWAQLPVSRTPQKSNRDFTAGFESGAHWLCMDVFNVLSPYVLRWIPRFAWRVV